MNKTLFERTKGLFDDYQDRVNLKWVVERQIRIRGYARDGKVEFGIASAGSNLRFLIERVMYYLIDKSTLDAVIFEFNGNVFAIGREDTMTSMDQEFDLYSPYAGHPPRRYGKGMPSETLNRNKQKEVSLYERIENSFTDYLPTSKSNRFKVFGVGSLVGFSNEPNPVEFWEASLGQDITTIVGRLIQRASKEDVCIIFKFNSAVFALHKTDMAYVIVREWHGPDKVKDRIFGSALDKMGFSKKRFPRSKLKAIPEPPPRPMLKDAPKQRRRLIG